MLKQSLVNSRTKGIVRTLLVCLSASTLGATLKILYGYNTHTLAFIADGIHSIFDSAATIVGMFTVIFSERPPDEEHPYGRQKFETVAAILLAMLLLMAAFEVTKLAYERFINPEDFPHFSYTGIAILVGMMAINLGVARYEGRRARRYRSPFLASDSAHNASDFWITLSVLVSLASVHVKVPYIDSGVSVLIAAYLVYLSFGLIRTNISPLVDKKVLDAEEVKRIVTSVEGVLHCHAIRSRGQQDHHFLDLNIHLSGNLPLAKAHEITHRVEDRLKAKFPGLVDVVIHTEPDGHPPCTKEG